MTAQAVTPQPEATPLAPTAGRETSRLRPGAIGLVAVLMMVLANAAPITAMTANTPVAVGFGNGVHAPGGFLVATVVLTIFSVGYVAMARHITATGAFYGFISHGLGQAIGMASGFLATMAYVVFEASLIGVLSSFAKSTVETTFSGPTVSWIWYALISTLVVAVLGYFDISLSGKVLGVFLVTEVVILLALAFSILGRGGGPDGLMPGSLNPGGAFTSVAGGAAGVGLFFAFWSWVGFETTAVYGEESKNPKKIVPRATMIAVIGLGLFYTFVSWMAVAFNGTKGAVDVSQSASPFDLFFGPAKAQLGSGVLDVYHVLTVTGSFACAIAFHNAASRYLYAMGREGISDRLSRTLGATHAKHRSPHVASVVQSVVTLAIVLLFFWFQHPTATAPDVAYTYLFGLMAILGTMAILIVQTISSISVVWYFHVRRMHPETASWWRTLLAPVLGAIGMAYVVYLLFSHLDVAAGTASSSPVFTATPWIVLAVFLLGLACALLVRRRDPERYALIGRTVLDDESAAGAPVPAGVAAAP